MTAVAIRKLIGSTGPPPAGNVVADNWIFGKGRGIYFGFVLPPASHASAPATANRALRNKIGFNQAGATNSAGIGILVQECEVYLQQNEIAGHNIVVQGLGTAAYPILNRCNLRLNKIHVQLTENANGFLGEARHAVGDWNYGGNVFGPHPLLATGCYTLDVLQTPTNVCIQAEWCDWGTSVNAEIEKRIRWRDDDRQKTFVDYSPVLWGIVPM